MTLVETVAKIKGRQVTDEEAKTFAFEQFGLLATHIRKEVYINLYDYSKNHYMTNRLMNTLYRYFAHKGLKVDLNYISKDLITNLDMKDFKGFNSVGGATIDALNNVKWEIEKQ